MFRGAILRNLKSISPRGWEIVAALAAPVLLLGALASGESILRIEQARAFGPNQAVETKIDETVWEVIDGRRRPRPNVTMGRIHINAAGFRGAELAVPKPEGRIRVGFFGGSTTLDPYVGDDEATWPNIAMAQLKSAYPGCDFDHFNAGVPAYGIADSRHRLLEDAKDAEPDITVFLLNDIVGRGRGYLTRRGIPSADYEPSWFARRSILWLKLEKNIAAERLKRIAARKDLSYRLDLDVIIGTVRTELHTLVDAAKAKGLTPILIENAPRIRREQTLSVQADNAISEVLYLPKVYIGDMTDAYYRFNDEVRRIAGEYKLTYIETMNHMPSDGAYYADSVHTTRSGSRILGGIVGSALVSDPTVQAAARARGCVHDS